MNVSLYKIFFDYIMYEYVNILQLFVHKDAYICVCVCVCVCNHDCAYKRYCCFKIGRTKSVLKMFEVKNR